MVVVEVRYNVHPLRKPIERITGIWLETPKLLIHDCPNVFRRWFIEFVCLMESFESSSGFPRMERIFWPVSAPPVISKWGTEAAKAVLKNYARERLSNWVARAAKRICSEVEFEGVREAKWLWSGLDWGGERQKWELKAEVEDVDWKNWREIEEQRSLRVARKPAVWVWSREKRWWIWREKSMRWVVCGK